MFPVHLFALCTDQTAIAEHCDNYTAADILENLQTKVSSDNGVTKFNISRSHVWEGARRAFLRSTYMMSVKFTDDIGVAEAAVDEGGPRREFLQLLVDCLASDSPLFTGPLQHKHLNPVHAGVNLHMYLLTVLATEFTVTFFSAIVTFVSRLWHRLLLLLLPLSLLLVLLRNVLCICACCAVFSC